MSFLSFFLWISFSLHLQLPNLLTLFSSLLHSDCSGQGTRHAEFMALSQILATHPPSILQKTDLYVTVEPCIMCASLLRQFKIRACYFGANNERFGGTGGVLNIHSDVMCGENGSEEGGGYKGYPAYGGVFREEAILLLRRFYVQDNEKVPVEKARKKERELKIEIEPWEIHGGLAGKERS